MSDEIIHKKNHYFTPINQKVIRDPGLSLTAIGLYAYLSSHADGYMIKKSQVQARFPESRERFNAAWKQLVDRGWIISKAKRVSDGKFKGYEHFIYDDVMAISFDKKTGNSYPVGKEENQLDDSINRDTDNRQTDNRQSDNRQSVYRQSISNNNVSNNNISNNNVSNNASNDAVEIPEYFDMELWNEYLKNRKSMKVKNTPRALKTLINKIQKIEDIKQGAGMEALEEANSRGWKSVVDPFEQKPFMNNKGFKQQAPIAESRKIKKF